MTRKYEELQRKDALKAKMEKEKEQKAHLMAEKKKKLSADT